MSNFIQFLFKLFTQKLSILFHEICAILKPSNILNLFLKIIVFIFHAPANFVKFYKRSKVFLIKVAKLSAPFFLSSPQRWQARLMLVSIIALNLVAVYFLVLINDWNRLFYDALQNKNQEVFWKELGNFVYLAFGFVIVAVYKFYLTQLLHLRWRSFMTQHYLSAWLENSVFFKIHVLQHLYSNSNSNSNPNSLTYDNPDQRIQEDVDQFCSQTLSLSMGLLNSTVTLVSFVGILWSLSGAFSFTISNQSYTIEGFLVWSAIVYAFFGTFIAHLIGAKLVPLNFIQQRLEALFRHEMGRVRESADTIALENSAPHLHKHLKQNFRDVLDNYSKLIKKQKQLTWFTAAFSQASVVFPFIVSAPRYFSGAIALGGLMQIASAFSRTLDALTWFVDAYSQIASWTATTERLTGFSALIKAQAPSITAPNNHTLFPTLLASTNTTPTTSGKIAKTWHLLPVDIFLPNGRKLFSFPGSVLKDLEHTLIKAPSGFGKSTLFKVISGCWHWNQPLFSNPTHEQTLHNNLNTGSVTQTLSESIDLMVQPDNSLNNKTLQNLLFISQKPFFPTGSLRHALTYMLSQTDEHNPKSTIISNDNLKNAMQLCGVEHFFERLDDIAPWMQVLSVGEAQRLNCVKIFLSKPDILFLDEITSNLDDENALLLYKNIIEYANKNNTHVVSIAHKDSANQWHSHVINLT